MPNYLIRIWEEPTDESPPEVYMYYKTRKSVASAAHGAVLQHEKTLTGNNIRIGSDDWEARLKKGAAALTRFNMAKVHVVVEPVKVERTKRPPRKPGPRKTAAGRPPKAKLKIW